MQPVVHRFLDRGPSGFANVTLASGERIFISLASSGLRVHRLLLRGLIPGRKLHAADAAALARAAAVIARSVSDLPKLPDNIAMDSFLAVAAASLAGTGSFADGLVDEDNFPITRLSLLTRLALASSDAGTMCAASPGRPILAEGTLQHPPRCPWPPDGNPSAGRSIV
jgi:hypothetical protein